MAIESFLDFLFKNNTGIIETLVAIVLVTIIFLAFKSFFAKDDILAAGVGNIADLETTLKKLLDKAGQVPEVGSVGAAAGGAESEKLIGEIESLKKELEAKKAQIDEIKKATPAVGADVNASAGLSDEEKAKLEAQIKDLQGKLTEYEIISEDIADLSFYKEQNAKLQKEVEAVKNVSGGTTASKEPVIVGKAKAAAVVEPPEVKPTPDEVPPPPPEVVPISEPVTPSPSEIQPPVTEPAPADPSEIPADVPNEIDKDLMADFDIAVQEAEKVVAASGGRTADAVAVNTISADDEAAVDLGVMDVDKIAAEVASIKEDPNITAEQALGTGLDENKLLQEASDLAKEVSGEDKKLMGQFENFVKKG